MPLSSILQTKAVLDSCAYNSLLMITVQEHSKRITQVFMFQCEETGVSPILPEPPVSLKEFVAIICTGICNSTTVLLVIHTVGV